MILRFLSLWFLVAASAVAQVGSTANPVFYNGTVAQTIPSSGLRATQVRLHGDASATNAFSLILQAPSLAGDSTVTLPTGGSTSQWTVGDSGVMTFSNTTTTGKTIDGSSDQVQLLVQGHSTQTQHTLLVEKSDGTDLLQVTNVNGTNIRGTTTNDTAAAGFVGEVITTGNLSGTIAATSSQYGDLSSISLTAGQWLIYYQSMISSGTFTYSEVMVSTTSGNSSSGRVYGTNALPIAIANGIATGGLVVQANLSATTTYYAKAIITYAVAPSYNAIMYAVRIR